MFGAQQMTWLKNALLFSRAPIKLVVNGSQMWNRVSRFEGWHQFATEQKAFAEWLTANRIDGVVFLSGDRHFSEVLKIDRPGTYPIVEFTSSPLTSRAWDHAGERPNARTPTSCRARSSASGSSACIEVTGPGNDRRLALGELRRRGRATVPPRNPRPGPALAAQAGRRVTAKRYDRALVWFRRDLRDFDHAALHHALQAPRARSTASFVFDREILDALRNPATGGSNSSGTSSRSLPPVLARARRRASSCATRSRATQSRSSPRTCAVQAVFANHDYEPAACDRDVAVAHDLAVRGIAFRTFKDQVDLRARRIVDANRHAVLGVHAVQERLAARAHAASSRVLAGRFRTSAALAPPCRALSAAAPTLEAMGFRAHEISRNSVSIPGMNGGSRRCRGLPAAHRPLSRRPRLSGGQGSVRTCRCTCASERCRSVNSPRSRTPARWSRTATAPRPGCRSSSGGISTHRSSGITRTSSRAAFKPEFARLSPFRTTAARFAAWCEGRTGYPIVDAAMRQLNATGYMHNRLRMIAASFLVKDLLVDWRWGERYFADALLDYDLASNNGGWQWAASTGLRRAAVVPHLQSRDAVGEIRCRGQVHPALRAGARARSPSEEIHAPWRVPPARPAGEGRRGRPRLSRRRSSTTRVARAAALALFRESADRR